MHTVSRALSGFASRMGIMTGYEDAGKRLMDGVKQDGEEGRYNAEMDTDFYVDTAQHTSDMKMPM